jgi:glycosyltransferase involved in cell wall biosynthesis
MKTTVIVSTYNRPDALENVLAGLRCQTRTAAEVIVADDGSGPDTGQVVTAAAKKSPFPLIHVWQEDRGFRLARIRNKAILRAGGDYIILLDGDCIPNRHFVNDHIQLAGHGFFFQGKRVLVGRRRAADFSPADANSSWQLMPDLFRRQISNAHHLMRLPWLPAGKSKRLSGVRGCNMGFFRQDLIAVNGFNEDFTGWGREDQELVARLYRYGLKRKNHSFMAICFHLWHPEHERNSLGSNDERLQRTIAENSYFISNGLVKSGDRQ